MNGWDKFETMLDELGAENLLNELANALSDNELSENMDYIARCYDIELEED